MADDATGNRKHSPEELLLGFEAWVRLGSSNAAAAESGIPAATLRWQKSTHPEKFREVEHAFDLELREKRRAVASEVVEGIREGVLVVRRLLRSDLAGAASAANAAASVVRALASVDANLDRFARLDSGSPTEITEDRRTDSDLILEIEQALGDPGLRSTFAAREREAVPA